MSAVAEYPDYPYGVNETANPAKPQMSEGVSEETTDPSSSQESGGDLESSTEFDDPDLRRSSSNAFSQPVSPNITRHNQLEHFSPGT